MKSKRDDSSKVKIEEVKNSSIKTVNKNSDSNENIKWHYKFKTKGSKKKADLKWPLTIAIVTFGISFTITIIANIFTNKLSLLGAIFVLISIVAIGILFDILGTAVVSADIVSFTSMASNKVPGSRESIGLIKNANIFSNIFNDVIGDTCGIISGATAGAIFAKVGVSSENIMYTVVSALIASVTVGGKAFGKSFAIKYATTIVYFIGRFISFFNIKNYRRKKKK